MKVGNNAATRRGIWFGCLSIVILSIKIFSTNSILVENIYAAKAYLMISFILRIIFGWLPFSFGDLLYGLAIAWFVWKIWRFAAKIIKKQLSSKWFVDTGYQLLMISMFVYIVFNIFWGINYNRREISEQLKLQLTKRDTANLKNIEKLLVLKVNESKLALINEPVYPSNKELFKRAAGCYEHAEKLYSFLSYKTMSVKSSMFSLLGNYFGFTGYYNPFTGEAQVNTRVPKFILPYTTSHEIAHQLGYAKEEEANFVGYLAATSSNDTLFHYSAYLDLFVYANRQLFYVDSISAKTFTSQLLPEVKADLVEWRKFLIRYQSPLEPVIRWAYGNYLRANQQPKGMTSYDEVIADLIAFYKKYGRI